MKYYILLIYLLAFSLATEGNTAVKDSLSEALPSASSPLQKLEIMTNLMDLSRQEEQVEYAKQLYWLALEEDEDYYKEAALTEILRFYVNTDAKRKGVSRRSRKGAERESTRFPRHVYENDHGCPCCLLHQRRRPDETD